MVFLTSPSGPTSCDQCVHWDGPAYRIHAFCNLPGGPRVRAQPEVGCAFWRSAAGEDQPPAPSLSPDIDDGDDISAALRELPPE